MTKCATYPPESISKFVGQAIDDQTPINTETIIIISPTLSGLSDLQVKTVSNGGKPRKIDFDKVVRSMESIEFIIHTGADREEYFFTLIEEKATINCGSDVGRKLVIHDEQVYIENGTYTGNSIENKNETNICKNDRGEAQDFLDSVIL